MRTQPVIASYGSWRSPVSASHLTAQTVRLGEPSFDGDTVYWLEARPAEKGRIALVSQSAHGTPRDLLAPPYSVRTRANEYGGGAYLAAAGRVFMVLDHDQRVYQLASDGSLQPITAAGDYRYADFSFDAHRQRLICIREDHSKADSEPVCEIVALALDESGEVQVLVSGADFYSFPRLSPDGRYLSWLCWHHPQMPWDGTECYIAGVMETGTLAPAQLIAGGPEESIFQPQWSPDGELFFVSDRTDWWNLYHWCRTSQRCQPLCDMPAEFATPQWVFGMSTYGFLDSDNILCSYSQNGQWQLAHLHWRSQTLTPIDCDFTDISGIACENGKGLLLGANAISSTALYHYDHVSRGFTTLAYSAQQQLPPAYLSRPRAVSFTTTDGETAHGFYYPPVNPDYRGPAEERPPLLIICHGGPTGATESSLNVKTQFWTTRGFAVLDVNYRGSTGYGRRYRDRLKNNWGITDVIDVVSAAEFAINQGWADPDKIAIRGSSAGGYTVLAALTFSDRFAVGASLYGIGDLETLARDTHKFESRYLDNLVGKYPEEADIYRARSPQFNIEKLRCPVIFLQGLEDKVVPPNQAEAMVSALTAKGIMNAYVTFAEEGHGFRQKENIERAIEAELFFYSKVLGFSLAETIEPLEINSGG